MIPNSSLIVSSTEPQGKNRKKVWMQKGKNLLSRIISGYEFANITSADIKANNYWFMTDFISIESEKIYYAQGFSTYNKWWFDKDKNFISCTEDNPTIAPSNAKYIRLNGNISNSSNMMVFQGTEETEYEAYIEPKTYIKNSNDVYEEFIKKNKKKILWENSTTSSLVATDITLSSNDYDELEIQYRTSVLYEVGDKIEKIKKGSNFKLSDIINNNGGAIAVSRLIKRNSDTSYTAEIAHYTNLDSSLYAGTESRFCIPLRIYGIKY